MAQRLAPTTPRRGVTLALDLPDASPAEVLEVADALHALALDLAPGARARTDVHLAEPRRGHDRHR